MLANSNKSSAAATAALTMDTNKVEEIPAKEPDLSKKPKKSALKKEYIGFKTPTSIPATSLIQYRNQRPRFNAKAKLDEETSSNSSGGESSCSSNKNINIGSPKKMRNPVIFLYFRIKFIPN